jgi:GTP-binding protein HflX
VILNVFLRHARTRRARIQVEIAHLEYLRPRIRGLGLDMDQQAGGMVKARGPGETASELLARRLDGRLAELHKQFARLVRAGDTQRKGRWHVPRGSCWSATPTRARRRLMNALTAAELSARDMPFETLDTTSRCLTRHGGDVILSDSVGFIRRLPPRLLASFESTLAEISEASLVVVVVDLSDPEWEMHVATTEAQISRLGAPRSRGSTCLIRWIAWSSPPDERLASICGGHEWLAVCSQDAAMMERLRATILRVARREHRQARVFVAYEATAVMASAYAECRVVATEAVARGLVLTLEGAPHVVARLQRAAKEVR